MLAPAGVESPTDMPVDPGGPSVSASIHTFVGLRTLFRMGCVVASFAQRSPVTQHILQRRIDLPRHYVVRDSGDDRQAVLIDTAVSLALFAQAAGALDYIRPPSFVSAFVVVWIAWHTILLFPPDPAIRRTSLASAWVLETPARYPQSIKKRMQISLHPDAIMSR